MSLEKLIAGIAHEAQAEADRIVRQAQNEALRIREAAGEQAQSEAEQLRQANYERCRKEAEQRLSQARLHARNRILEVRLERVDAVFDEALSVLRTMDDDAYRAWMKHQLLRLYRSAEETVVVAAGDRARLNAAWRQDVEQALRQAGTVHPLRIEYTAGDLGGGFLLRHPRYEVDASFETLLESLKPKLRAEVATALFESEHANVLDHAV